MTPAIDITAEQRRTVLALLNRHLPDTAVWACGGRVKGTSRPASDLDLVVFARPEQSARVAELRDAFEESNLPFRVDLFVWDEAPESFHEMVERDCTEVAQGSSSDRWQRTTLGESAFLVRRSVHPDSCGETCYVGLEHIGEESLSLVGHGKASDVESVKSRFLCGDILFGKLRPYFRKVVRARFDGICSTDIWVVRPSRGVYAGYLFYVMASQKFIDFATQGTQGTRMPRAQWEHTSRFPLRVPPFPVQREIARVLGSLDDKIELNRRMNETLEAMARALFNSWFVDFDPVRAKMEGRDTGLSKPIADLFPDRLVESELSLIPKGWRAGRLADIATASRRNVDPASLDDKTPYIGLEHMPRRSIALTAWEGIGKVTSNKSAFKKGEVLFGKLRPYFHKVGIAPINGVCSTDIVVITSKAMEWSAFVLLCASSIEFVNYTNQSSTGTKMPRTNWKTMGDYRICLPVAPVARAFQDAVQPVHEQIVANVHESHTLAALRDALLPKLISGEIRLRDVERQVECVA